MKAMMVSAFPLVLILITKGFNNHTNWLEKDNGYWFYFYRILSIKIEQATSDKLKNNFPKQLKTLSKNQIQIWH